MRELRALGRPADLGHDVKERRFVEHTLQIAIQAALDVASHVVSDRRLGEPRTNRELFDLLARASLIPPSLAVTLQTMAGFRNILVHGYQEVDVKIVKEVVQNRLDDLLEFVRVARRWLEALEPPPAPPSR